MDSAALANFIFFCLGTVTGVILTVPTLMFMFELALMKHKV